MVRTEKGESQRQSASIKQEWKVQLRTGRGSAIMYLWLLIWKLGLIVALQDPPGMDL